MVIYDVHWRTRETLPFSTKLLASAIWSLVLLGKTPSFLWTIKNYYSIWCLRDRSWNERCKGMNAKNDLISLLVGVTLARQHQ